MTETNTKLSCNVLLCFLFFMLFSLRTSMADDETVLVKVGVVLDFDKLPGKMGLSCINMALSNFYASHGDYKTRLSLITRDSKNDVVAAAAAALDLIKNHQVTAIIGPSTSTQAKFIIELGDKAQVPIISFSATSPSLSPIRRSYFIRATQNDSSQVKAISALVKAFGWREAVPIYVDNEFGEGIVPTLADAFQEIDARIPYRSIISEAATDQQIVQELEKLKNKQTRVFIVHISPSLCSRVFAKAKEFGMMGKDYVWIVTNGIIDRLSSMGSSIDVMQGVLGLKTYVPNTNKLQNVQTQWKMTFQEGNSTKIHADLDVFGLRAYDAAIALAMAIEKVGSTSNFSFKMTSFPSNQTDLKNIGISQMGPTILQAILKATFKGLAGDFQLVNGQLQASYFEIVNIVGNATKALGFWTPKNGLTKKLNLGNERTYSTSKGNLRHVLWPGYEGESEYVPKGWEIPINGKNLIIGVPLKSGFKEFVNVTYNSSTNKSNVSGYCIDVFDAVMKKLPYNVSYKYVPFENSSHEMDGNYNDLIYQVFLQKFDAVVGDITILAKRSLHVDFTLPYTESGVSMIAPMKDNKAKNAWVFLKPLTWDLWGTSACFFVFIGFVVWVLEHRINPDFRGPPLHQVGTSLWFSFSTMVFAHRERVMSNLGKFVVIIWAFVVLILTQSYTASLTSRLTVQQLQPTVTDVNDLIKRGENVGYLKDSFVLEILKEMKFSESKLIQYDSPENCRELLLLGSANGGIAAAFDETPYMRLFLSQRCSEFTMVEQVYKTDGFGFVFPRESPLVSDVSRAILQIREEEQMLGMEKKWFGENLGCPDKSKSVSSHSLGLDSFWGLFLIAGAAAILALTIFMAMFICQYRQNFIQSHPNASKWKLLISVFRFFDQKDMSSHTFKKDCDGINTTSVDASPDTNWIPSPSSYPIHTDANYVFSGEQETPLNECAVYDDGNPEVCVEVELGVNEITNATSEEQPRVGEFIH